MRVSITIGRRIETIRQSSALTMVACENVGRKITKKQLKKNQLNFFIKFIHDNLVYISNLLNMQTNITRMKPKLDGK